MKKYFNKTLFKKEWVYGKWVMLLLALDFIIIMVNGGYNYLNFIIVNEPRKEYWLSVGDSRTISGYMGYMTSSNILAIFSIIAVIIIIIGIDSLNNRYELLNSMPYTRTQIIFNKWLITILIVLIATIISFIVLFFMYVYNFNTFATYNSFLDLIKWFILTVLTYAFIVTFMVCIQCLCGNVISGGLISGLVIYSFYTWREMSSELLSQLYKYNLNFSKFVDSKFIDSDFSYISSTINLFAYDTSIHPIYKATYPFISGIIVLIIASLVSMGLMIKVFNMNKLEKLGNIVMYKPLEYALKIWIALSVAAIGAILGIILFSETNKLLGGTVVFFIFGILSYYSVHKIIRVNG